MNRCQQILSLEPQALITGVIEDLLTRPPKSRRLFSDARIGLLIEGRTAVEIPPDILGEAIEDGAGHIFDNPLAYLMLSYILSWIDMSSVKSPEFFPRILDQVGSVGTPIFPVEFGSGEQWRVALPVSCHNLPCGTTLVDSSDGILEPITDAVRRAGIESPEVVGAYVETLLAREEPPVPLLYRVWTATSSVSHMATPAADAAKQWAERLDEKIQERFRSEGRQWVREISSADRRPSIYVRSRSQHLTQK